MNNPKTQSFALVLPDGTCHYHEHLEGADSEAIFAQVKTTLGEFQAIPCARDAFPADRDFVGARKWVDGKIIVDLDKAHQLALAQAKRVKDVEDRRVAAFEHANKLLAGIKPQSLADLK